MILFSGGRSYYSHPSLNDPGKPKVPHQSSATGMQAIPATGTAMGLAYKEKLNIAERQNAVVVCSMGDAAITEGEVAEAFQMAALKQLPILYLIQDNEWDISATADEIRAQDASGYIQGFHGITCLKVEGNDFLASYQTIHEALRIIREERRPVLVHATVPLLNHHTSGVRMEWYRHDLEEDRTEDPFPIMMAQMIEAGFTKQELEQIENEVKTAIKIDFEKALAANDPQASDLYDHIFAPTNIVKETGTRVPAGGEEIVMVDAALKAIEELMSEHKECLLYGQDVGGRLGGVF